ncbi:hypothetical protein LTR08_004525 [Meristemomyces frigidus]|nr:hypothetical protein LTR08_004525 [Meristemomyces frigidus]
MPDSAEHTSYNCLLSFPLKVRNHIYGLVLPNEVHLNADCRYIKDSAAPQQPALTRVSRQIRQEALEVYYSHLTVRLSLDGVSDLDDCRVWFNMIGTNFSCIERFTFENVRRRGSGNGNYYGLQWGPEHNERQLWRATKGVSHHMSDLQLTPSRLVALIALNDAVGEAEVACAQVVGVVKTVLYGDDGNDDSDPDDVGNNAGGDSEDDEGYGDDYEDDYDDEDVGAALGGGFGKTLKLGE